MALACRVLTRLAALTFMLSQEGCQQPSPLTLAERDVIDSWLLCIECDAGLLDSVRALAGRKPQTTVDTLTSDLLSGLSAARLANLQRQFDSSYRTLADYAAAESISVGVSQADYVSHYLGSLGVVYRLRAAVALARIGGSRAKQALNHALDSAAAGSPRFGPRVTSSVRVARDSLWTP